MPRTLLARGRHTNKHLTQGRNVPCSIYGRGHVVLPPVAVSSVASSLFLVAGERRVCVISRSFFAGGCTCTFEAARQGKTAVVTVVSHQTGCSIHQAPRGSRRGQRDVRSHCHHQTDCRILLGSSTSQTRQSRHLPFVRRCTATFLATDDTACQ